MDNCPCSKNCHSCEQEKCSESCLPKAPDNISPIQGDKILILSRDKAALNRWSAGEELYFEELYHHDTVNSKFNFNGYSVFDGCSLQYKGETYLIGGSYWCESDYCDYCDYDYCQKVNGRRAIMKLSNKSCGLDWS